MEIKGFTYGWDSRRGMFSDSRSLESMKRMAQTGTQWAALAFGIAQEKYYSTHFGFDFRFNSTDREIEAAVANLHSLGLKVCMKPVLNCMDGTWRAHISFPEREFPPHHDRFEHRSYWQEWFSSYTAFIRHYAEIAEYTGCEMFCIGCEMLGTERKEEEWRALIDEIRSVYSGPLVYNTNHGHEDNVRWFDALDYIGTSAYYRIPRYDSSTIVDMTALWDEPKKRLKAVSKRFGKKIIFMEIGCRSARGCADMPWDFTHREFPYDEDEQAMFYESALCAMWNEPYFAGFFWWDWSTFLPQSERLNGDTGFGIYGKKAEEVLRKWYLSEK